MELDAFLVGGADDPSALGALRTWLEREPAIQLNSQISLAGPPAPEGSLGVLQEFLHLAFTEGFPMIELALSVAHWRKTRAHPPKVVLTLPGGDILTIIGADQETAEKIKRLLASD